MRAGRGARLERPSKRNRHHRDHGHALERSARQGVSFFQNPAKTRLPWKPGPRGNQDPVGNHGSHPEASLPRPRTSDRDASPDMEGPFGGTSRDSVVLRSASVRHARGRRFQDSCVPNHGLGCEPSEVVIE